MESLSCRYLLWFWIIDFLMPILSVLRLFVGLPLVDLMLLLLPTSVWLDYNLNRKISGHSNLMQMWGLCIIRHNEKCIFGWVVLLVIKGSIYIIALIKVWCGLIFKWMLVRLFKYWRFFYDFFTCFNNIFHSTLEILICRQNFILLSLASLFTISG